MTENLSPELRLKMGIVIDALISHVCQYQTIHEFLINECSCSIEITGDDYHQILDHLREHCAV